MRKIRGLLIGYAIIGLLTCWPVVLMIAAGVTASVNGCTLNEAGVHACVVGGRDVGSALYTMSMTMWFLIALIPLGAIAGVGWTTGWLVWTAARRRKAAREQVAP